MSDIVRAFQELFNGDNSHRPHSIELDFVITVYHGLIEPFENGHS